MTSDSTSPTNPFHPLPCRTVEELFQAEGRQRVRLVTEDWLRRHKLTATEFMHSAAALAKFEAAGNSYQHAVQRMAVTLSSKSKLPVVQYVKALTALSTAAIHQVSADERGGRFPELDETGLIDFAETLAGQPNGEYLFCGALAKYLGSAPSWSDKLASLVSLAMSASGRDAQVLVSRMTDEIVAELIGDPKILAGLLEPDRRLGETLQTVIKLFRGDTAGLTGIASAMRRLGQGIARGAWPKARHALAGFILESMRGTVSFTGSDLPTELEVFADLVATIEPLYGPDFVYEDYLEIFAARSRRFVTPEALFQFTSTASSPDDKLARVLDLEAKVYGAANKRALAPFALTFVSAPDFEENFAPDAPGSQRLRRLAELQRRVQGTAFPEGTRDKMVGLLDAIAVRIEVQGKLLAGLEVRFSNPAERVAMILKLFENGVFTQGALSAKARRSILTAIASPGFAGRYTESQATRKQDALMGLVMQLKEIGVSPEESVRAMTPG